MEIILFIIGAVIGLFSWSSIWGCLFAAIPVRRALIRQGLLDNMDWKSIIAPLLFSTAVLILMYIFSKTMFYGSLLGCLAILFNIGSLKREELENLEKANLIIPVTKKRK